MPDPRQTVESIRVFLSSQSTSVSAQLIAVAADYAEMCRDASFRLRRCADFLREGFRAEALAYAATRPPLVDVVSDLQFRELPDWERVCTSLGLARPTRLSLDTTANLVEADRQLEPLRELLAKHRYLAARASLPARLQVLRQLIAADPQNPLWRRDAEELTQARMATLRTDATAAIRAGDPAAVDKILAELNAGTTAAPEDLKDALYARASAALRESAAIAELRALLPGVREASAAMSYDSCRQILAQWGKIVRESRVNVPPELRAEIIPLARWLDDMDDRREHQREFRAACETLADALQNHAPLERLNALYRVALGYETELPEDLLATYRRVTEAAKNEVHAEQRKQFAFGAVLVGVIVIGLLVLGYVMFGMGKH